MAYSMPVQVQAFPVGGGFPAGSMQMQPPSPRGMAPPQPVQTMPLMQSMPASPRGMATQQYVTVPIGVTMSQSMPPQMQVQAGATMVMQENQYVTGGQQYGGPGQFVGYQPHPSPPMQMQQQQQQHQVHVEVIPEIQPNFSRIQNGAFRFELGPIMVRLRTECNPPPPHNSHGPPFKPYEEFVVDMPEMNDLIFDVARQMPPGAQAMASIQKRGAVLEVPQTVGLDAMLKANSPHGALILEDIQVVNDMKQKVAENTLHYRLQVDGALSTNKVQGSNAHRLEVDLTFHFHCHLTMQDFAYPGYV